MASVRFGVGRFQCSGPKPVRGPRPPRHRRWPTGPARGCRLVLSDAELVFGADHAFGDLSADLALLDFEGSPSTGWQVADGGDDDLLSRGHIRGAQTMLSGRPRPIHGGHPEPVGIRMLAAGGALAHDHAAEPRHSGHLLQAFHLETAGREDVAQVLGGPGGSRVGEPGGEPSGNLHDAGSGWVGREFSPPPRAVGRDERGGTLLSRLPLREPIRLNRPHTTMAKKILIVEDNQFLRTTTADILQLAGYEVIEAEHGKMGVERAQLERLTRSSAMWRCPSSMATASALLVQ